ncbi:hypothetical protein BDA96_02G418100 [Sorghum bicolor]|uniref:Large ribosomal subunit protein mL46 n=2 Tax=Sorghum bicolor TaxID=4558 RepID=A0A921RUS9_SORBI|nr:54S ribosomal protein L17, mitochondrial isoform X1 [Sorghum bicolor]EER97653.1 hypothetical protein SORBI_3002G397900 [Sorghum bicolor]KAG0546094.1 hypothetical protein BDA96_02G418100 [Sorghum bicolor]|eukprot:XP_002461132.1 54S ribosomal protein L17, mitochondrial isoform X1 [Sorghum bicolor]
MASLLLRSLRRARGFSSSATSAAKEGGDGKLVATVMFERLPVVIPKIHPAVYAFQEFSFRWRQQHRRQYPDEVLGKADARGKGDYHIDYVPAPRITEADRTNDQKSLQRALDNKLYLLLYGNTYGAPDGKSVWHFPEKIYENEETMRLCAESALKSVLGGLDNTYFVGNAPMAHMDVEQTDSSVSSFKRFFFKSQVVGTTKYHIEKCKDYAWVTKDELLEHFPEHKSFLNKMIIHIR